MTMHLCPESECCYFGKPTHKGCGCHKTDEQVLREQRDELLKELGLLLAAIDLQADLEPFMAGAEAAIRKATGATI